MQIHLNMKFEKLKGKKCRKADEKEENNLSYSSHSHYNNYVVT